MVSILISAHQLKKSFTSRPLFDGLTFSIESGERVGLIGPNGAGKSTLLKILAGLATPDDGKVAVQRGLRVAYLEQVPSFQEGSTVESTVLEGAHQSAATDPDIPHDWDTMAQAQKIMAELSLAGKADVPVASLSGGWKKRVALARELLKSPDLFLLDEPTNHLDIDSILWLENLLARAPFATITITHDRLFLQKISNRIIEIDRRHPGGLLSVNGDYSDYVQLREDLLAAQEQHETKLRNTLRRETEWLRRGAQARQTKQQARIQKAQTLKDTVDELKTRNRSSSVNLNFQGLEKNPKKLVEAIGISKSYNGVEVIPQLDLLITPKSRLGLMGPNGCGKSTLIKLLTGVEKPNTGTVKFADNLQVSTFEQNRETLDQTKTVADTVCPDGDYVDFMGNKVHVKSYLSRFLFSHEQMDLAVRKLSGGEQSRLLIAKLMLRPANLLVLDEPTNDLDIATLDVLEDVLQDFNGAVILVTHDRYFLDHVTPQILGFGVNRKGKKELVPLAGLEQWEIWEGERKAEAESESDADERSVTESVAKPKTTPDAIASCAKNGAPAKKKKLSYKDQREYDSIEATLHSAEEKLARLTVESSKPENLSNSTRLTELSRQMAEAQTEVDRLYARWQQLEQMQNG
jgi:ABC transport system ATP-binding/permease protein